MLSPIKTGYCISILLSCLLVPSSLATEHETLAQQRKWYDQAQAFIDQKKWSQAKHLSTKVSDYPLAPYLDYRLFRAELGSQSPQQVEDFIHQYSELPFSTRIRAAYIDHLYQQQQWQTIVEFQKKTPVGERYQCIYYYALLKTGNQKQAFMGAESLWKSGQSVSDTCDDLFSSWDKAGLRTDSKILQRMELAFQQRNETLLGYLNKQLKSQRGKAQGKTIVALYKDPKTVTDFAARDYRDLNRENLAQMAFEKYARQNSQQAKQVLEKLQQQNTLSLHSQRQMENYLASRYMSTDSSSDAVWRDKVISTTSDQSLLERRVRLAIADSDLNSVVKWIGLMSDEHKSSIRWQYWLARAEISSGQKQRGEQRLSAILGQRHFYSAAAASYLNQSIDYPISAIKFQQGAISPFQETLTRIAELISRDKITVAKSEWRYLLSRAKQPQKQQLAVYAASQRWHHLTVVATISAKMWDNLALRFPIAHKWWFDFYAKRLGLDPMLLMALSRQESAMDVEARSPVGARGIMQIMPATASYTAKKHKISYGNSEQLYVVGKNIEIGSNYLKELLEQYDGNRIFALAAYNAGPSRVKRWRESSAQQLDAIAFIEAIPFRETRGYVQNILMFQLYYYHLMSESLPLLTLEEVTLRY